MSRLDVVAEDHGSLWILRPVSADASAWIEENVDQKNAVSPLWWGDGLVVEPRYVEDILDGMIGSGFAIQMAA